MRKLHVILTTLLMTIFIACSSDGTENNKPPIPTPEPGIVISTPDIVFLSMHNDQWELASFTANTAWSIELSDTRAIPTWFDVSPRSGDAGSVTLKVSLLESNELYDDRNAFIKIKAGDVIKTIMITQKKKDAIIASKDKVELGLEDEGFSIEIQSNILYEVIIPENYKSWISKAIAPQSDTRGLTTKTEYFSVEAPTEAGKREGYIIFKNGDIEEKVSVFQVQKDVLLLTENNLWIDDIGIDNLQVELRANIEYEVIIPTADQNWVEVTSIPRSGAIRTDKVYFKIEVNNTYGERRTEIEFKDKNSTLSDILTINQGQNNALIISPKILYVEENGGSIGIQVESNVEYDVILPEDSWITNVPKTKGLTTNTHTFNVSKYLGNYNRSGTITFKMKGSDYQESVIIIQSSSRNGLYTVADMVDLSNELNKGQGDKQELTLARYGNYDSKTGQWSFRMMADIDLNPGAIFNSDGSVSGSITTNWTPIGGGDHPFEDCFDGNGFRIKGLTMSSNNPKYVGLFGYVSTKGLLENVVVESGGFSLTKNDDSIISYISSICGYNEGTITGCVSKCHIKVSGRSAYVGGIAGSSVGTISNAANFGTITITGAPIYIANKECRVAGLVGYNQEVISNSSNFGKIIAEDSDMAYIGGVCGSNEGYIYKCENKEDVKVTSSSYQAGFAGGICGMSSRNTKYNIAIEFCANFGNISMSDNNYHNCGGICGSNASYIAACYNEGNITSNFPHSYLRYRNTAGGICGSGSEIIACYNTGSFASGWGYGGGITGESYGNLVAYACYNAGSYTPGTYKEGICGHIVNIGKIYHSYENADAMTNAELLGMISGLNNAINSWNMENADYQCDYEFYSIAGEYPKLRKK